MNSKQLSYRRNKLRKRWRVFFVVVGSIGVGIIVLGLAVTMTGDDQPVSKFYTVGLAFATLAVLGYGLSGIKLRLWPRTRRRRRHRSRPAEEARAVPPSDAR